MSIAEAEIVNYGALENSAALKLNPRQISFVHHYLECKVLWKAAERAGYSGNSNTLHSIAWENLQKPAIRAYYEERLRAMQVSADEVLAELGEIARYNVSDMGEKSVVRPVDKLKALELAGKYHKLFTEKVETDLDQSSIERLADSIISGLFAAAQARQASAQPQLTASPDTDPSSSSPS